MKKERTEIFPVEPIRKANWVFISLLICLTMIQFFACSYIEEPADYINPMDPSNPDYEPPAIINLTGPASGSIINSSDVNFTWDGNQDEMEFSTSFNNSNWTAWSTQKTASFSYLIDGPYSFQVKSRYPEGTDVGLSPLINFQVNAISGPALIINPLKLWTHLGNTFFVLIQAEEVQNLSGVKIKLKFNPLLLKLVSATVLDSDSSIFGKYGGTIIQFIDFNNINGSIELNVAVAGGYIAEVDGTGPLARMEFIALNQGLTDISFSEGCEMRNSANSPIAFNKVKGIIEIE